nr:ABC transporter permease [Lysinibacter cavernae]
MRIAGLLVVIWGAVTIAFFSIKLVPGDPVDIMLGPSGQMSQEKRDQIREGLGLDLPVWDQYTAYLGRILRGDLGESYQLRKPVVEVIGSQLAATLQLTAVALAIAVLLIACGALLGRRAKWRGAITAVELIAVSAPVFWTGLLLLGFFSFLLGWFPISGSKGVSSVILPAVTIAIPISAVVGQVLRRGIESAEQEPFIETVRARGVAPTRLLTHHTLRHAANGTLTLSAYIAGSLIGGAVLVETIFGRSGLGRVTLDAILARDLPTVLGVVLVIAFVFVAINTVVDLLSEVIDPRLSRAVVGMGRASS